MNSDDQAVRTVRERTVREHIESETRHSFGETVGTFDHPRYEVVPTGEVHDGGEAVLNFLGESHEAFPDFRFEDTTLRHCDDGVFVESTFVGQHLGNWRGLPPTGRQVSYKMCNFFLFEGDQLICERLYFDRLTVMQQLGIARDPESVLGRVMIFLSHPISVIKALAPGRAARPK